jgi:hypothetical protein
MTGPADILVSVDAAPAPGLLRPAIEAALAGRAFPAGPEAVIARAFADAVAAPRPVPAEGGDPSC